MELVLSLILPFLQNTHKFPHLTCNAMQNQPLYSDVVSSNLLSLLIFRHPRCFNMSTTVKIRLLEKGKTPKNATKLP